MAAKKRNGEFPNSSLSLINREERAQTKKLPEKSLLLNSQNYSLFVWGGGKVSTKMYAQHLLGMLDREERAKTTKKTHDY
jgi:hypothetical protein